MDQRHVEIIFDQLHFAEAKGASIFGTREDQTTCHSIEFELMSKSETNRYRMVSLRLNYLAMDRLDLQHSTKEASEHMVNQQEHHWNVLKRTRSYLIEALRVVQAFRWHAQLKTTTNFSDSDWASNQISRKPASGGMCRVGPYVVKIWSSTQ